jgi:hypothetical protein
LAVKKKSVSCVWIAIGTVYRGRPGAWPGILFGVADACEAAAANTDDGGIGGED